MSVFKGAGVAITTPFDEKGEVDFDAFAKQVDRQIEGNTDAIIVCGTTGEASTLSHEEHIECVRFVVNHVNKRVPVIAGTGSNSTETAVWLSQQARMAGADALLLVTPYYNKATQKGLYEHFEIVAKKVDLPIILYNIPGRTGVTINATTVADMCKNIPNIVGVKDATGNISLTMKMMSLADGNIDLYSGNDDQIVPLLSLGGLGVISVLSNIAPRQTHDICAEYFAGNTKKSAELQFKAIELIDALFCEVNPIPVKMAMKLLGIDTGVLRRPLTTMEPAHAAQLTKAMETYGLL